MLDIDFINETDWEAGGELEARIRRALNTGLELEEVSNPAELTVSFVSPEQIRQLNAEYRDTDRETDVLSFPVYASIGEILEIEAGVPVLLGDIINNPYRAREQAEEYGQSFEDEVEYLSIHSLMHLLGYDHMQEDEKRVMRDHEKSVLAALGEDPDR